MRTADPGVTITGAASPSGRPDRTESIPDGYTARECLGSDGREGSVFSDKLAEGLAALSTRATWPWTMSDCSG